MTVAEFIRELKKQGIKLKRHGAKHDLYWNPATGGVGQVPRHSSKEIKTGTRDKILKDLGLK